MVPRSVIEHWTELQRQLDGVGCGRFIDAPHKGLRSSIHRTFHSERFLSGLWGLVCRICGEKNVVCCVVCCVESKGWKPRGYYRIGGLILLIVEKRAETDRSCSPSSLLIKNEVVCHHEYTQLISSSIQMESDNRVELLRTLRMTAAMHHSVASVITDPPKDRRPLHFSPWPRPIFVPCTVGLTVLMENVKGGVHLPFDPSSVHSNLLTG